MDFRIRPARPDERDALEALQRRASLIWEADRAALLAHPDAIDLPLEQIQSGRVFVAEDAGAVVGFCVVLARDAEHAELDGLFVEPAAMRRGHGAKLLAHAEKVARAGGAQALSVVASPDAVRFYERCGFIQVGVTATRFRAAPVLCKALR